jgi:CDP-diglyceride synthetase
LVCSRLICICWGWFGEKYLVIASVFAWGLGDAAAALVGKYFGQHYIEGRLVEGRKSLEGTFAMFVVSFVSVMVVLLIHGTVEWHGYMPDCGSDRSSMCSCGIIHQGRYGYTDLSVRGGGNHDSFDSLVGWVIL